MSIDSSPEKVHQLYKISGSYGEITFLHSVKHTSSTGGSPDGSGKIDSSILMTMDLNQEVGTWLEPEHVLPLIYGKIYNCSSCKASPHCSRPIGKTTVTRSSDTALCSNRMITDGQFQEQDAVCFGSEPIQDTSSPTKTRAKPFKGWLKEKMAQLFENRRQS